MHDNLRGRISLPSIAILAACLVGTAALFGEFCVVVWWLGDRYERFDLSGDAQS